MKTLLLLLCLGFCLYYVNATCFSYLDKNNADKKTCLDRQVNLTDYNEKTLEYLLDELYNNKDVDTCCYVEWEGYDYSDNKKEKIKICLGANKGRLSDDMKKYDDWKKELEKELKEEYGNEASKYLDEYKKPDINCFSSFLNFKLLLLIFIFL